MTAAFGTLTDPGEEDIHIVSAGSDVSSSTELHRMFTVDAGVMAMRQQEDGLTVPADGTHELSPGGDHLMFMDLTTPVTPGDDIALDLLNGVDRVALQRLMRIWTDDTDRLARGVPGLADTEPELSTSPARLTVTVDFGPPCSRRRASRTAVPSGCRHPRSSRWTAWNPPGPTGIPEHPGSQPAGTTMRNLVGQVDVTRDLDTWNELDRSGRRRPWGGRWAPERRRPARGSTPNRCRPR